MGKFAPVFLAYILNCFGVNIFRENTPGCEPLVSCLIFLTAIFLLLWDMRLYPSSLRKLSKLAAPIVEFLIAAFLMEHIMTDFWFPLESSLMALLPKIAIAEADILKQGGWNSGGIFSLFALDGAQVAASYILSLFFLLAILHATRVIDLRLLSCGLGVFVKDIVQKYKKFKKKILKFIVRKRQVKFKVKCNSSRSRSMASNCDSSDYDACDNFEDADEDDCYTKDDSNDYSYDDDYCYTSSSRKY